MKRLFGGLAALTPADNGRQPIGDLSSYEGWHNPNVTGFRLRLTHGRICPSKTKRDWSVLDNAMGLAHTNGKLISVSIAAGFGVGSWVYKEGVQKYTNADGSGAQPLPWDTTWQHLWFAFIDELAAHVPTGFTGNVGGLNLSDDTFLAEIIPCGFMGQNAGMLVGSSVDEAKMPHVGFADVDTAYIDAAEKILTHYQTAFPTTPFEITYTPPFKTTTGTAAGLEVLHWFKDTYPDQGGSMISAVFSNTNPDPTPPPSILPHGGQCVLPVFHNKNQAGLYVPPIPSPLPPYPGTFVDMVNQAVGKGMQKLECYQADLINADMETLTESSSKLKANILKLGCSAH